jgi:glycosyltransferase involved in cell wall biosynthesis
MEGTRTGVEEYTLNLLNAMGRLYPRDRFLLFYNSARKVELPPFSYPHFYPREFRYPNKLFNLALKFLRRPCLDCLVGGADVFFCPSARVVPVKHVPLVVTFHDLSFVRYPYFFSWQRRLWHRFVAPAALAHKATRVVAVSRATAMDLRSLYCLPAEKIRTIWSGVREEFKPLPPTHPHVRAVRRKWKLPPQFVLFLGTLEPRKNIEGLLWAFREIKQRGFPHLLVIAGRRGWKEGSIFRLARNYFRAGEVIFTGFVTDKEKPALYSAASLFVYPSFYEGFGFPPLEALCCGTPVITSTAGAIPEIAGPYARLVEPYDVAALTAAIEDFLRHPFRVSAQVREKIRRQFSWEKTATAVHRLFEEVAATGS